MTHTGGFQSGNQDITVVICCFNYGQYINEAIASVLEQTGGPAQIIVVDDGSTDPTTMNTLTKLPDSVELIRQPNQGVSAARNAGLKKAETEYVLCLDADDKLRCNALQLLRNPLDQDATIGFTFGDLEFFDHQNGVLHVPQYNPFKILYRSLITASSLMRKKVFAETGGFDTQLQGYEDWELWVHAFACGWPGKHVGETTVWYRKHGDSLLHESRQRYQDAYQFIRHKHASLYQNSNTLAKKYHIGFLSQLVHQNFWGPRPLPARIETKLQQLFWRIRRSESLR